MAKTEQETESRQERRRMCFEIAMRDVNEANLTIQVDRFNRRTGIIRGMKRKERRALARAYAAKMWRETYRSMATDELELAETRR